MRVQEAGESGQSARAGTNAGKRDDDDDKSGQGVPEAWRNKRFRLTVLASTLIVSAAFAFVVGRVIGLGNQEVLSAIPKPATGYNKFIEDGDLTAQDSEDYIFESTTPGMVHILSGGASVGIGLVLTESGKVLTTYQPAKGATNLAAEYVLSGKTFKATVIGADPAAGLALLQLQGGDGRAFATTTVGNSATVVEQSENASEISYHVKGQVDVTAVGTTGKERAVSFDLGTLTDLNTTVDVEKTTRSGQVVMTTRSGLMASTLSTVMNSAIGGPLVNLKGQVIGIIVGGSGSGLDVTGYAIPINTALAVATQIADGNS